MRGSSSVAYVAGRYGAGIESTARKMVDLWSAPAMLLIFSFRHNPSQAGREAHFEPRLRLDYTHQQGPWPYARRHKSVDDGSPIARAWKEEQVDQIGSMQELTGEDTALWMSARTYGRTPRVVALATPAASRRQRRMR